VLAEFPRLTAPANLSGVPALSLPAGFGAAGLPVGLQLMAARNNEEALLTAGAFFQRQTDWHLRRPSMSVIP
jgi:Asp-tRNA(Asn)/Glu-tRNA(Gln) amidotransferase A subunit family amidase